MQATAYLELKLAWELFKQAPETLELPQREELVNIVARQHDIERRILQSPEAANVMVPQATLANRLAEIHQRYESGKELEQELHHIGLDADALASAVECDLKVEAILEKVASGTPTVTAVDAEIYYRLHPTAFDRPEARKLRHILITFDNHAEQSKVTLTLNKLRLNIKNGDAFGQAALRHSQCPTAMEGGILGTVKRGQLYPELDAAAFTLAKDEISPVLQSPIGLHILYCEEILPYGLIPFEEVCESLIERLTAKRCQEVQRSWIKSLYRKPL